MFPDGVVLLFALQFIVAMLIGLGLGVITSWRLAPPRVVYRDPPTLQEVWFRAYREARRFWVSGGSSLEGAEAVEAFYRKTADAAVASAKKTKCHKCGALPVVTEEPKP